MKLIVKYGHPAAITFIVLGCLCLLGAFLLMTPPLMGNVWMESQEQMVEFRVDSPLAANWLGSAGIKLFPQDAIFFSGLEINAAFSLPLETGQILVYKQAVPVTLVDGENEILFYSSSSNLGEALWEEGIVVTSGDKLTFPLETPLTEPLQVMIDRGQMVTITVEGNEIQVLTSAQTVSGALLDAGITLQGLDFSLPAADQTIPEQRKIEVVRVREEMLLEESEIPFTEERTPDSDMMVGEQQVLQAGQNGIQTTVTRVRFENGTEISSQDEWQWISRQPVAQQTAYGTKVVIDTSPDGMVNYWLSKEVMIGSYKDTGQPTATGIWPYYGVIAVSPEWFTILRGSSIYVPGYGVGTVLDKCGICSGKDMIDVFIPTDDYVPWHRTETVYFMPPMPSGFSGDLP